MRPIFDPTYKKKKQVEKYIWSLYHELVLFQKIRNCFRYIPDNDIEGDILVWNPSMVEYGTWETTTEYLTIIIGGNTITFDLYTDDGW